jgi:hypothetical protein
MKIQIPISVGELLDKISILSIKSQHTSSEYVKIELQDLIKIAKNIRSMILLMFHNYSQSIVNSGKLKMT